MNIHPFVIILETLQTWALHGGYTFIFIVSTLEAVPLIGSTIPGHTSVIIAGFLSRIGVLNVWIVMLIASFGAVIGDMIGFYIGKKYGLSIIEKYKGRFFLKEEYIDKARHLIEKHTGKALVFGRFNPVTRPFMPLLVGASHGSDAKFWFYNIAGGILWAVSSVAIGYAFGVGYHAAAKFFGKAVVIVTIVTIISVWGYNFVNRTFHIFRKYELIVLGLNLLALFGFLEMMQDAWSVHSFMANLDVWVSVFVDKNVNGSLTVISQFITDIGSGAVTLLIGLFVGIRFLLHEKWRSAVIMLVSVFSTFLAVELVKAYFLRARPLNAVYLITDDPSFPSAHAALAAAFFFAFVYLYLPKMSSLLKRELLIAFSVVSVILIGISRITLNVHWVSDVIGGWSLGIFCATSTILLVRYAGALLVRKEMGK